MNKKILVAIFLLMPVACLMLVGSANYAGICVPKMRVLSDEEKIEAAINLINEPESIFLGNEKDCKGMRCKRIPYESVAHFLKENPNSCVVQKVDKISNTNPVGSFWDRAFGFYSGEVACGYKDYYYNDQGEKKFLSVERTGDSPRVFITNCGKIYEW